MLLSSRERDSSVGMRLVTVRGSNPGVIVSARVQIGPGAHPASYTVVPGLSWG